MCCFSDILKKKKQLHICPNNIYNTLHIVEKLILFRNLITWPILSQMISNLTECVETQNFMFNVLFVSFFFPDIKMLFTGKEKAVEH